jgi:hypothetical protein
MNSDEKFMHGLIVFSVSLWFVSDLPECARQGRPVRNCAASISGQFPGQGVSDRALNLHRSLYNKGRCCVFGAVFSPFSEGGRDERPASNGI